MSVVFPARPTWRVLLVAIVVVLAVSWLFSLLVTANMPWYDALTKPSFTPPSWSFGVVWPLLYIAMTVAAWLVWRQQGKVGKAQGLFAVQLFANYLWTPLFFGLHSPMLGLLWIILVWCLVAATLVTFWRIHKLAGVLFLPYLGWVSFAAALTASIHQYNG